MVQLFKRDCIWHARLPGNKRISLRTTNKQTAEIRRRELEAKVYDELRGGPPAIGQAVNLHFSELVDAFIQSKHASGVSPSTIECLESAFDNFGASLPGDILLREITIDHVENFTARRREGFTARKKRDGTPWPLGHSAALKTIRNEMSQLSSIFRYAVDREYILRSPMRLFKLPKNVKSPPRFFRREDYVALMKKIDDEYFRSVVDLYVLSGMRRSEGIMLRVSEHVDLERKILTVPQPKSHDFKIIPISTELEPVLKKLVLLAGDSDQLVRFNEDTLTKRFAYYVKKAELPKNLTFHALRHTFCTNLAGLGVGFSVIQQLAGHRDPESTKKYIHPSGDLAGALAKLKLPPN